jgi:hypothetical protein
MTDAAKYTEVRQEALHQSALQALAIAMMQRNRLSHHHENVSQLVTNLKDTRHSTVINEIAANTVTLLAMHEQLAQMQLLLTGLTQMQATELLSHRAAIMQPSNGSVMP